MPSRLSRHAPLTGIAFFALLAVGFVLTWNTPSSNTSAAKVLSFYTSHQHQQKAGNYLIGLSLFFGLFFLGNLSGFLRRDPAVARLAAIAFGGAVLFAAAGGVSAGVGFALADVPHHLNAGAAQALNLLSNDLGTLMLIGGLGVVLMATGLAIVRSGLLPRALGWFAIVFGVVALTPIGWFSLFALGLFVLILVPLLYRRDRAPAPATTPAVRLSPSQMSYGAAHAPPRGSVHAPIPAGGLARPLEPVLERALHARVERVEALQRQRLNALEAPARRGVGAVVAEDAVLERERAALVEDPRRALAQQTQADLDVAEQPALRAALDRGAVGELARLADVVDDRRRDQEVRVEPRVAERELLRERRDGDRVLEQAAEVGVVARARAGRAAQLGAEARVGEERVEQAAVAGVGDLAREMLEEAVELVEVAVGDRQEVRRVGLALGRPLDPVELDLRLLAEAHDAAARAHELARLEAAALEVGVAEDAGRERSAAVAQLDREVGRARARREALLARAREDAVHRLAGAKRRESTFAREGSENGGRHCLHDVR